MDVSSEFQKIGIRVDKHGLKPPLEEVSAPVAAPVDPTGVAERDVLHDTGQRDLADLDREVNMCGHKAEGMDAVSVSFDPFLKQKIKTTSIGILKEDVLACVSPQHYMVKCGRKMNSWFPCHGPSLFVNCIDAGLTLLTLPLIKAINKAPTVFVIEEYL
jgi:hypothetical protein